MSVPLAGSHLLLPVLLPALDANPRASASRPLLLGMQEPGFTYDQAAAFPRRQKVAFRKIPPEPYHRQLRPRISARRLLGCAVAMRRVAELGARFTMNERLIVPAVRCLVICGGKSPVVGSSQIAKRD